MFPIYHFSKMKEFFCLVSWNFSFESLGFRKLGILNRNCWRNLQQMWRDYKICEQGTPLLWTWVGSHTKYPIPQRLDSFCFLNFKPRKKKKHVNFCFSHNKINNAFQFSFPNQIQHKSNVKNCGDTDKMKGIPITFIKT